MKKESKAFSFTKVYKDLTEVLMDHKLAALGDAYINFAYSLALSQNRGQPSGAKVRGSILAEAFKKAGLRAHMPSRVSRHMLADAAEALTVYAWLHSHITLEECVAILEKTEDPVEGFTQLFLTIRDRVKF
ncbi:MAG: ribonuclease III family protein [Candidatus Bathyarchaeales archaeon]